MSLAAGILTAVATKVGVDLTKDLLGAVARTVRRQFDDRTEARKALDAAVRTALTRSLASKSLASTFPNQDASEDLEGHLRSLLKEFLGHEDVNSESARRLPSRALKPDLTGPPVHNAEQRAFVILGDPGSVLLLKSEP